MDSGNAMTSTVEYWATRKPLLLFRLSGLLLLRFDTRVFVALLFHEPPRKTRKELSGVPMPLQTA